MPLSCLRLSLALAAVIVLVPHADAGTKTESLLSAAHDIRVLVPSGFAAKWPLYSISLDQDGQPSYNIRRRYSGPDGAQTVATLATQAKPEIPRTRPIDEMSEKQEVVRMDQEVFVPAFNRKVRYYLQAHGGGADNDYYATEPVAWPDGHGGTLWIVIEAEVTVMPPAKMLASVEWAKPGKIAHWKVKH